MDPKAINLANILLLAINPRDEYTQVGVFRLGKAIFLKRINHSNDDLKNFKNLNQQRSYRSEKILDALRDNEIDLDSLEIIMGRGGLINPVESGVYEVNDKMKHDLENSVLGEDIVNLGGLLARDIAGQLKNAKAYIANPVVVDEFNELARVAGHPLFKRKSIFHALNQKYVARKHAASLGLNYEDMRLIVVTLGRAITIGIHYKGKVIDATQGFDGDGPFSPVFSGSLPVGDLIRMCYSGDYSEDEMMKMVRGKGGLYAYLGTPSGYEIDKRIQNEDEEARFYFDAMAYQVAKSVGSMCMTFKEKVDGVIITGAMANSQILVDSIIERISKVGNIHIYPGDDDLDALAWNGFMMQKGALENKIY